MQLQSFFNQVGVQFIRSEEYLFFALILRLPSGFFQPGGEFFSH
jgi:hypothetical protein